MAGICGQCGSAFKDGARFCPGCGQPVQQSQPIGAARQCAFCGANLKETAKFCPRCGRTVGAAGQPQTDRTPQSPVQRPAAVQPQAASVPPMNPATVPPRPKKSSPAKILIPVIAVILVGAILFTGLVAPGWMKGSGAGKITPVFGDKSYVQMTLPEFNQENKCLTTVANLAVQAQVNAMLTEELFYRAVSRKASVGEIKTLLQKNSEAWEIADVLSSSAYLMGKKLSRIEESDGYKSVKAMLALPEITVTNPFVTTVSAMKTTEFENAQEWAEYITRLQDHAEVGKKTAYVAKILKVDAQRAKKAIELSQAILKGEADSSASVDDKIVKSLMATKAAGKVAGVAAGTMAAIASGGAATGILAAGGMFAGGVDCGIEVTDTALQLTLGEDHTITKAYQDTTSKAAPVIAVLSFINVCNPEAWSNGIADAVGQFRYLADSAVDLKSGKLFGVELGVTPLNMLSVLTVPVGEDATPEDNEKAVKALVDMGVDEEIARDIVTPLPDGEEPNPIETSFEDMPDETLEKLSEDTSLSDEEWEDLFREVYDEYLEEMKDKGYISGDDEIWDYDPFMPFEDFPQDGDEIGFEDLSMWAKPEKPYDDDDSGSEEDPDNDNEEPDPDDGEPEDEDNDEEPTEAPTEEPTEAPAVNIEDFMGSWYFTDGHGEESTLVTWSMRLSGNSIIAVSSAAGESESFRCSYRLSGETLYLNGEFGSVSFILSGGELIATADGETTVMHR